MYYGKCENGEYGAYAKAFLSNLHQPEVGIFISLAALSPTLLSIISIIVNTLSNANLVASRHMKMEMASLPVDLRRSTTLVLKLPDSSLSR